MVTYSNNRIHFIYLSKQHTYLMNRNIWLQTHTHHVIVEWVNRLLLQMIKISLTNFRFLYNVGFTYFSLHIYNINELVKFWNQIYIKIIVSLIHFRRKFAKYANQLVRKMRISYTESYNLYRTHYDESREVCFSFKWNFIQF